MALAGLLSATLVGCQSVPLKEAGTLTSYGKLGPSKGMVAKKRLYVDGQRLVDVKTVRIAPTTFSFAAASKIKSDADRDLVSNALDRALCVALSDRYQMVPANQPADLTVRSVIADIVPTDKALAGVSTAITIGTGFVLPVSVPRLPVGLGGLAVEAEAVDASGLQSAAMLWARGANSILDKPRVSEVGDAYSFSTKFADAFSQVLISGKEPKALDISLPTRQRMQSWLGGKPKYAACDAFGRAPGLVGAIAAKYGAPPQWTDKKPKAAAQQAFNSPIAR
ncbi:MULTISPECIES: DUF3313 domain-containing protein [Ensifer]|uniref:DUF3313 domain-containing protein n=1 Tax=unclassified Ensifer TaxID=2633371 RepID=UPI001CF03BFC|nr:MULTISPECIES: DUF3313 domain-containing protein [Ensifer]MDF8356987.1 DUF3313 domain-containing protein [Ensifer adhaerens]UCM24819.1 DUF3313 domain-containing protein [Ensifer adhaerens]UTV41725.1 DUF3313 domain-containing protein [Ensifer adhaerens]